MKSESIKLTQKLVSIESVSSREKEIMLFAKDYFQEHGIPVSLDEYEVEEEGQIRKFYNIEVGEIKESKIIIAAHLDTVDFNKEKWEESQPLSGEIEDGKLYGRGAADTKSNAAAAMVAIKNAYEEYSDPEVALVLESDEENRFNGAKRFLSKYQDEDLDVEFTVMCEPENLKIVNEHKGLFHSKIKIERKVDEKHASKAQKVDSSGKVYQPSENAIEEGIPILIELKEFKNEIMQREPGDIGPITFTITIVKGGKSNNVIPQEFIIETDSRVPPEYSSQELANELEKRIDTLVRDEEFETYAVHEAVKAEEDNMWTNLFRQSVKEAGIEPETKSIEAFTELGLYQDALDVPGVIFGTSPKEVIHNPDEYVDIESISIVQETFENMIEKVKN